MPQPTTGLFERVSYDQQTGCWNFIGSLQYGYGQFCYKGSSRRAHRVAASLWLGMNINDPRFVLHKCDNPKCINPKHLFFGTIADNNKDKAAKGRSRNGFMDAIECVSGHPFSASNTYICTRKNGAAYRTYKECRRLRTRRRRLEERLNSLPI